MKTKAPLFQNPEQEASIIALEKELYPFAALMGKQNGSQNLPTTEDQYRAYILNTIEAKVQAAIDKNHQRHLPISGRVAANKIEQEAKETVKRLTGSLHEDEFPLQELSAEQKKYRPNLAKKQIRVMVTVGAIIIALAEAFFAHDSLRYAGFSKLAALFTSIAIAAVIGFGIHAFSGYVQQAKHTRQYYSRLAFILIPAFFGFLFLGQLRTRGLNEEARLNIDPAAQVEVQSGIPALAVTGISFILFAAALMFSVRYAKTNDEQIVEQEFDQIGSEIRKLKNKMRHTREAINQVEVNAVEQSALALATFEYALAVEKRLITIARQSRNAYADTNLRSRTDGQVPSFFIHPPEFKFNLFFNTPKN